MRGVSVGIRAGSPGPKGDPGELVSACAFGCTGDGSDQTSGFTALGAALRAGRVSLVHFGPGEYRYRSNRWMWGVSAARLIGSQATFVCTAPMLGADADTVALRTNDTYWGTGGTDGSYYQGAVRVSSVDSSASALRCLTPADAAQFQVGDLGLLSGYEIYPGGWPPSCRYVECVEIAGNSPSTGDLTLVRPTRFAYDERWRDGGIVGAPRLMRLTRRQNWCLSSDLYLEGIEFAKGPGEPSYLAPYNLGSVHACGARRITMVRCRMGYLDPTCVERFTAIECDIDRLEIDKFVDSARFESCRIGRATGGTSAQRISFRDCQMLEQVSLDGNENLTIDNCDVHGHDGSRRYALINATARSTVVTNNRLHRDAASIGLAAYSVTGQEVPVVPVAVGSGYIKTAYAPDFSVATAAFPGNKIYTKSPPLNEGTISAIYWDGTNYVIEASFNRQPEMGVTYYVSRVKTVVVHGNSDLGRNDLQNTAVIPFPYRADVVRCDETDGPGRVGRISFSLESDPSQGALHSYPMPGIPVRVFVAVTEAVGGYRCAIFPSGSTYWQQTIDCSQPGWRQIDAFAVQGTKGLDSLSVLPAAAEIPYQINVLWSTSPGSSPTPKGMWTVEYMRLPGAAVTQ